MEQTHFGNQIKCFYFKVFINALKLTTSTRYSLGLHRSSFNNPKIYWVGENGKGSKMRVLMFLMSGTVLFTTSFHSGLCQVPVANVVISHQENQEMKSASENAYRHDMLFYQLDHYSTKCGRWCGDVRFERKILPSMCLSLLLLF